MAWICDLWLGLIWKIPRWELRKRVLFEKEPAESACTGAGEGFTEKKGVAEKGPYQPSLIGFGYLEVKNVLKSSQFGFLCA
jgi:hypothetical protein